MISACDHRTAAAKPTWEQPGLVATAEVGDRTELRVYSPADWDVAIDATATTNGAVVTSADVFSRADHFVCGGGPFGGDELACVRDGKRAEIGVLIGRPNQELAQFRSLGKLPGRPFTGGFASPDGKRLLAQRADGFSMRSRPPVERPGRSSAVCPSPC
ncbi:hypothetical protein ACIA5C_15785 [Actinoplanes sp. NPDC051343]|uniref:hypothetical protein n=1 Tax=Actinoplanes sp. NPDC051343 TaxID=3363906 RepID=UPI003787FF11